MLIDTLGALGQWAWWLVSELGELLGFGDERQEIDSARYVTLMGLQDEDFSDDVRV